MLQAAGARNVDRVDGWRRGTCSWQRTADSLQCGCVSAVKMLNSVGAGDSMVAGFVAGYLEKE